MCLGRWCAYSCNVATDLRRWLQSFTPLPCLASFTHYACGSIRHSARGLASRRSLRLRLHSLRSARGRFRDFITFFISPFRYHERYERKRSDWSRRRKEQSDASLGTERGSGMKHMSVTEMKWRFNECAKWNDIATFNW